jgi:hypothetical protein
LPSEPRLARHRVMRFAHGLGYDGFTAVPSDAAGGADAAVEGAGLDFTMPKGVAKLFSAVAGVFVMALISDVRIHRIGPTFDKRRR